MLINLLFERTKEDLPKNKLLGSIVIIIIIIIIISVLLSLPFIKNEYVQVTLRSTHNRKVYLGV